MGPKETLARRIASQEFEFDSLRFWAAYGAVHAALDANQTDPTALRVAAVLAGQRAADLIKKVGL